MAWRIWIFMKIPANKSKIKLNTWIFASIFYTSCLILIKFGIWDLHGILLFNCIFHWNWCNENHTLCYGINNFLLYLLRFCLIA
jgi:hypothetical protein